MKLERVIARNALGDEAISQDAKMRLLREERQQLQKPSFFLKEERLHYRAACNDNADFVEAQLGDQARVAKTS